MQYTWSLAFSISVHEKLYYIINSYTRSCTVSGKDIWSEKFQLDQIQNAIINFNMPDIWQTVPDS